jgi:hypothetical protein
MKEVGGITIAQKLDTPPQPPEDIAKQIIRIADEYA